MKFAVLDRIFGKPRPEPFVATLPMLAREFVRRLALGGLDLAYSEDDTRQRHPIGCVIPDHYLTGSSIDDVAQKMMPWVDAMRFELKDAKFTHHQILIPCEHAAIQQFDGVILGAVRSMGDVHFKVVWS